MVAADVISPWRRTTRDHLANALHLARPGHRLQMHPVVHGRPPARWPKLSEPLTPEQRRGANFLVVVAGADGPSVSSEDPHQDFRPPGFRSLSAVHALTTGAAPAAEEPVTVIPAGQPAGGYAIPGPPRADKPTGLELDMKRVEAKIAESAAAVALLSGIFTQEEAWSATPPETTIHEISPGRLDAAHTALLRFLCEKGSVHRDEFEAAASGHGLLPDAAIEMINDAAFQAAEHVVLDGDDPIEIDIEFAKEILRDQGGRDPAEGSGRDPPGAPGGRRSADRPPARPGGPRRGGEGSPQGDRADYRRGSAFRVVGIRLG